jgi:hypothetical protein
MKLTRRDLLAWTAGATAGALLTPVPWKILGDASIWTQNWPWIPQPARGPVEVQQSNCTLCPNGCGMRVRMAVGWAVGVSGSKNHPVTHGGLCPLGFAAHQLNWHPQRLRTVRHENAASSWSAAQTAFEKACSEGPVVFIDGYPERAASEVMQSFAKKHNGSYRVLPTPEVQALAAYETWSGVPAHSLGYDLENAQTIVSFGAPLLEGWGIPGRFTRLWAESAGVADPPVRLIQIEPSSSRTSARAWRWIKAPSDANGALAAGLARVLIEERLVAANGPLPATSLEETATRTGLSTDAIRDLAHTIAAKQPALVIANAQDPNIAALNVVLGAIGTHGGIIRRSKADKPYVRAGDLVGSARAVVIDASVPWAFVPETGAEVFRFAAWNDGFKKANWLLPAPGFLEELTDVPSAPTSAVETYAVATPLMKAPPEIQSLPQFLVGIDSELPPVGKLIEERCDELFRRHEGDLHTLAGKEATVAPVSFFDSVQKLKEQLWKGAVWTGALSHSNSLRCSLKEWPSSDAAQLAAEPSSRCGIPISPPLASKLHEESALFETPTGRQA